MDALFPVFVLCPYPNFPKLTLMQSGIVKLKFWDRIRRVAKFKAKMSSKNISRDRFPKNLKEFKELRVMVEYFCKNFDI